MKKLVEKSHFAKRTRREEYKWALTAISVTHFPCLWVNSYVFFLFLYNLLLHGKCLPYGTFIHKLCCLSSGFL